MPFIQVSMGTGRTPEQKKELLEGIVEVVHTSTGAAYDTIRVWIVELDPDEVMVGNETLTERRARVVAERLGRMYEPRSQFLTIGGLRFHFLEWGREIDPPVLILHGFSRHAWQSNLPAQVLAKDHRVLALDQRGHGDSDHAEVYGIRPSVDDVLQFLDALGIDRVALVGHSLGGIVGFSFTALHPERVRRLVLGDIGPEPAAAGVARIQSQVSQRDVFTSPDDAYAHEIANSPTANEAALRSYIEHNLLARPDGTFTWKYDRSLRDGSARYENFAADEQWAMWAAVAVPTLILRGELSDILSEAIAARMLATNPHAELVTLPGSSHSIAMDVPDLVTASLASFLASSG